MAEKKRNPGAGGTGASGNHRKKSPKSSRRRRRTQPFTPRREYWLYDGQIQLGTLITKHTGGTAAFDAARRSLGRFPTFEEAKAAINEAYAAKAGIAA